MEIDRFFSIPIYDQNILVSSSQYKWYDIDEKKFIESPNGYEHINYECYIVSKNPIDDNYIIRSLINNNTKRLEILEYLMGKTKPTDDYMIKLVDRLIDQLICKVKNLGTPSVKIVINEIITIEPNSKNEFINVCDKIVQLIERPYKQKLEKLINQYDNSEKKMENIVQEIMIELFKCNNISVIDEYEVESGKIDLLVNRNILVEIKRIKKWSEVSKLLFYKRDDNDILVALFFDYCTDSMKIKIDRVLHKNNIQIIYFEDIIDHLKITDNNITIIYDIFEIKSNIPTIQQTDITPLDKALENKNLYIIKLLLNNNSKFSKYILNLKFDYNNTNDIEIIKLILSNPKKYRNGKFCLMDLNCWDKDEIIKLSLREGWYEYILNICDEHDYDYDKLLSYALNIKNIKAVNIIFQCNGHKIDLYKIYDRLFTIDHNEISRLEFFSCITSICQSNKRDLLINIIKIFRENNKSIPFLSILMNYDYWEGVYDIIENCKFSPLDLSKEINSIPSYISHDMVPKIKKFMVEIHNNYEQDKKHLEILKIYIKNIIKINQLESYTRSASRSFVSYKCFAYDFIFNDIEFMKELISCGLSINGFYEIKATPKPVVNYTDYCLTTLLFESIRQGLVEIVKFLVENGADINEGCRFFYYTDKFYSPLYYLENIDNLEPYYDINSLKYKYAEIKKYLLDKGAKSIGYGEAISYMYRTIIPCADIEK